MGILGGGVGVLMKGSGSGSPSFVLEDLGDAPILHPFRLTARTEVVGGVGTSYVKVRAGTVNNKVPTIGGTRLDSSTPPEITLTGTETHRIYIKVEIGASPVFFPDTVTIINTTTDQTDADEDGYLLIGTIVTEDGVVTAINQFVYASQVVVRAKPGTGTAIYLWTSR